MEGRPEAAWLAVGRVRRPHGVHGEVTVETVTDFPERVAPGVEVGFGQSSPELETRATRIGSHLGGCVQNGFHLAQQPIRFRERSSGFGPVIEDKAALVHGRHKPGAHMAIAYPARREKNERADQH